MFLIGSFILLRKFDTSSKKEMKIIKPQKTKLTKECQPTARKKPKMMGIHSGTNDLTYKVNTMQKIRKVINAI